MSHFTIVHGGLVRSPFPKVINEVALGASVSLRSGVSRLGDSANLRQPLFEATIKKCHYCPTEISFTAESPASVTPRISLLRGVQATMPARHNAGKARVANES